MIRKKILLGGLLTLLLFGSVGGMTSCNNSTKEVSNTSSVENTSINTETKKIEQPISDVDPQTVKFSCPDNITYYLRDDEIKAETNPILKASLAKNESEGMQLVINCPENVSELSITVSNLKNEKSDVIESSNIEIFREHYIEITQPTTKYSKVGFYPDALVPVADVNQPFAVKAGENQGYWFTVTTSDKTQPGIYSGEATIHLDCGVFTIPISVEVWDFVLPVQNTYAGAYAIWGGQVADYYGYFDQTDEENWYWFLNKYRINATNLPVGSSEPETFVSESERFIRDERVRCYNIPFYWHWNDDGTLNLEKEKNEKLLNMLREKGLLDKGYYYLGGLIDEPSTEMYDRVKEVCSLINEIAPEVPHVVTTSPTNTLKGYVDTWCRLFSNESKSHEKYIADGDGMWWYGCVGPKYPSPNYHTDSDLLSKRICFWMQKDFNITGDLYWSVTIFNKYDGTQYIKRDVWNDPMAFPGAAGDGYLLYPGMVGDGIVNINAPVATMRLEAIRDGIEDMEYLVLLEKKVQNVIEKLNLVGTVSKDDVMQSLYNQLYKKTSVINRDTDRFEEMRRLVASYLTTDIKSLLVLSDAQGETETDLTEHGILYVPSGSNVAVTETEILKMKSLRNADVYEFDLKINSEVTYFDITVDDITTTHMAASILNIGTNVKKTKILTETPLMKNLDDSVIEKLKSDSSELKDVSLGEINGQQAIHITFNSESDWTQLNITDSVMSLTDFSQYTNLAFKMYVETNNLQTHPLYISFNIDGNYADDGRTPDDFALGGETEVFVPYSTFSRLTSLKKATRVSVGTWGTDLRGTDDGENYSIYLYDFRLVTIG